MTNYSLALIILGILLGLLGYLGLKITIYSWIIIILGIIAVIRGISLIGSNTRKKAEDVDEEEVEDKEEESEEERDENEEYSEEDENNE